MPLIRIERPLNWMLLRFEHKLKSREVYGYGEEVRRLWKQGDRILFTPNHPTRTDPQFMGEVSRTTGSHCSFMAAYDIFLEHKLQGWFMQKSGTFSIDREGNDRKAMSTAIDTLKQGRFSLTIFPEGNVYHRNDQLTPIMDGTSFIATKAQQMLKDDAQVWVVPISIKYTNLTDVRPILWEHLTEVAEAAKFPGEIFPEDPLNSVVQVGAHMLQQHLRETWQVDLPRKLSIEDPDAYRDLLHSIVDQLLSKIESELGLTAAPGEALIERIRKARSKIQHYRTEENRTAEFDQARYIDLCDRSLSIYRMFYYIEPYLMVKPTIDRYAETVARLREDYFCRGSKPYAPRKGYAKVGKPISLRQLLESNQGKTKAVLPLLSDQIAEGIQSGVDDINTKVSEIGSQLIT